MAKVIQKPINDLVPYENNPRRNEKAVDAVANSIREFGFKNPVIIDHENVSVSGHTRRLAAIKLGLEEVPCILVDDLSEEQIRALRLADNRVASYSEWDEEKLHQEISEILNIDVTDFGFDEEVIDVIKAAAGKEHICPKCGHRWED